MAVNVNFTSAVEAWVRETKERMGAVFVSSAEDVIVEAQALSPFDTGFNAAAVVVEINNSSPPPVRESDGGTVAGPTISASLAGVDVGDVVHAWFVSAYAARLEYGFTGVDSLGRFYDQPPRAYVRRAAQNWKGIVARNTRRLSANIAFSQSR